MELTEFKSGRETLKALLMDRPAHQAMAAEHGLVQLSEYKRGRFFEVPGVDGMVRIYEGDWYVERANGHVESMSVEDFEAMTG